MKATKRARVKALAAVIGGTAVLASGALTIATDNSADFMVIANSDMKLGASSTQTTPPTVPPTPRAVPPVKARPR